jgi:hypothetical protein
LETLTTFFSLHIQVNQLINYQKSMQSHGLVKISNYYRGSGYSGSIIDSFLLQDYHDTDYPVTLPLRRPYSGDPGMMLFFLVEIVKSFLLTDPYTPDPSNIPNTEILDEEEFGESSASRAQDTELTQAEQLGLMVFMVLTPFTSGRVH